LKNLAFSGLGKYRLSASFQLNIGAPDIGFLAHLSWTEPASSTAEQGVNCNAEREQAGGRVVVGNNVVLHSFEFRDVTEVRAHSLGALLLYGTAEQNSTFLANFGQTGANPLAIQLPFHSALAHACRIGLGKVTRMSTFPEKTQ
jgi:hypothetical protein